MKLTETQLREIRERCDAATAGPWEIQHYTNFLGFSVWAEGAGCIAERWYECTQSDPYGSEIVGNAQFIAHARTDIPTLLDDLAESQNAHQTVKAHMDACRSLLNVPDDEVLYEAIKELRAERDALKAELEAQRHTALMWEQDFTALCRELGEEVTIETVDSSVQVAIEKVQALKAQADALATALELALREGRYIFEGSWVKKQGEAALAAYRQKKDAQ